MGRGVGPQWPGQGDSAPAHPPPLGRGAFEEVVPGPRKEHARSDSTNWRTLREEHEEAEEGAGTGPGSWRLPGGRREAERWRSTSPGEPDGAGGSLASAGGGATNPVVRLWVELEWAGPIFDLWVMLVDYCSVWVVGRVRSGSDLTSPSPSQMGARARRAGGSPLGTGGGGRWRLRGGGG